MLGLGFVYGIHGSSRALFLDFASFGLPVVMGVEIGVVFAQSGMDGSSNVYSFIRLRVLNRTMHTIFG